MLIQITVKNDQNVNQWDEQYTKPDINNKIAARQWAKDLINWFNHTAKPGGSTRTLVKVETFPKGTKGDWRTTRLWGPSFPNTVVRITRNSI